MTKIFTIAHVPPELTQRWLQHLRDFDTANKGCHFEVLLERDAPTMSAMEMIEAVRVDPALTFTQVWERGKK